MNCERCNKKKATVFYRENAGGRVRALRLCSDCAEALERAGELEDLSTAISGFTSPYFHEDEALFPIPLPLYGRGDCSGVTKKCRVCGTALGEITASGRLGCGGCYATFSDDLEHMLTNLHGHTRHRGKISASYRMKREKTERLKGLKKQLQDAVSSERYESAIELRDVIRALEAEMAGR